jgi:hypothetical protein
LADLGSRASDLGCGNSLSFWDLLWGGLAYWVLGEWVFSLMWWGIFAMLIFLVGGLVSGRLAFGMRMPIVCDLDQKLDQCHWYELLFLRLVL